MEILSTSPSGRFQVQADVWEPRHSLWVYSPSIWDVERSLHILLFEDASWSVDKNTWLSETKILLILRKFPGNHRPEQLNVEIDCITQTATIPTVVPTPLTDLESVLNRALIWV